ncbi:methyltransferase family protein [Kribbella amoyensis]|uniref:Methyltransferase family protein n=1 Tax=Kribbella amoyensis TaxID=996641 RepID=A0A561B2Y8_9ACTN|nr:class I SAM-dependent methyltransferase [Kribbella amoyensis]TWD73202.1 methyltransferase family protein [Kribbella amoyensis]
MTTDEVRTRNRAVWAAGSWDDIAELVKGVGPKLLDLAEVDPGMEVLDVACGSGSSVAVPAAERGARVVGSDLTPEHFDAAERRATAAGVVVEWVEADAEDLPFEDGRFDRVLSTFGHMFAPDQDRAGAELVRVCKPGGSIALATWTPDGYGTALLDVIGRHLPPAPGSRSPGRWGDPDEVRRLLPGLELTFHRDQVDFRAPSVDEFARFYDEKFGPLVMARQALGPGWPALRDDVLAFDRACNTASDGSLHIVGEYLVTLGVKPATG